MLGAYFYRMSISLIIPLRYTFTGVALHVAVLIPEELVILM